MAGKLRDPLRSEQTHAFGHRVTVGMLVSAMQGPYGGLGLEEFTKCNPKGFLTVTPVLDSPMDFPSPEGCDGLGGALRLRPGLACWLSFMVHQLAGEAFEELAEVAYAHYEEGPSFTEADLRAVLVEGLRRFEQQNRPKYARPESKAKQLDKSLLGSGPQGQQVMRDIGLAAVRGTGRSFLGASWRVMRPETPGGVWEECKSRHVERLRLASLELAAERVQRQPVGSQKAGAWAPPRPQESTH